jgi:ABC-type amino acid transport substrate-binding protein
VVREALSSALRAIIADGTYDKILSKWNLQHFALKAADIHVPP